MSHVARLRTVLKNLIGENTHRKNLTSFKGLDKVAALDSVESVSTEEGGVYIRLAPGFELDGDTVVFALTIAKAVAAMRNVTKVVG